MHVDSEDVQVLVKQVGVYVCPQEVPILDVSLQSVVAMGPKSMPLPSPRYVNTPSLSELSCQFFSGIGFPKVSPSRPMPPNL